MTLRRTTYALGMVFVTFLVASRLMLADPSSPVTVAIVDSPDPVASGSQLGYTITVVNTGGSKLTNVVLSDQVNGVAGIGVPPQLQLSSTRGSCSQSGNLVTCNAGSIEGNGSWMVTILGVVTAANGSVINDTATVSGTRSAQNFTTTATATTLVSNGGGSGLPDLTIGKAGPTSVQVNAPMTYTLTINNTGTANATGVKVVDTLPAGVTNISATGTSLFACGVVGLTVTCTDGAVNQGTNATITINANAPATPDTITNTAVVDPDNTIVETNELNNTSALVNTQVTASQTSGLLTIDKTDGSPAVAGNPAWAQGAGPDPVNPGQTLTYKIHVVNTASTRADDVRVVDGTQGLVAASVTAQQAIVNGSIGTFGGCTVAAPQVTCSIKSLNPGGTMDVTITGQVITSAGSTIFNTATVTGNISNKGVIATDSEITTVKPAIDLTITKADSPDPVCAASWPGPGGVCQGGLMYTFVVGNSGTQQATGVVVRDPLPQGLIYVPGKTAAPAFSGCAVDAVNVVTCSGGTINGGSTATITIVVVAPPVAGTITNTVTVDPNNAIFEADETNNTFTQTTQVSTGIDLTVAKHSNHEANFVATRGTLTYTITVSNIGTQDATGVTVRDTLPADTIFRDAVADASHGFTCSQAGGIVNCVGGHLQGTESMNYPNLAGANVDTATITVRIFATPYEQPAMHNEVRVDPLNQIPEANELNNIATQDTKVQSGGATSDAFNELTITKIQKTPDPTNTARNAVVTYEIKVGNDGTDPVTGVKVRDTLPAGARYIEATGTNSFLCAQQALGVVDCIGGQIPDHTPAASGATITLKAFAPDTPGTYTNQVEVDPDHVIPEGNEFNNNASAQTVVKNGGTGSFNDLTVSFEVAPASTATTTPGGPITYRLDVSNLGTDPALNVAVRDTLPMGVTFVSAVDAGAGPGAFTCTQAAGVIDCIGATIAGTVPGPAGTRTVIITATAPNQVGGLVNQAIADPNNAIPEGDETNNTATFATSVESQINLTVTKTGPPSSDQSQQSEYDITVTNTPPPSGAGQTALGIVMHDPLPVGLIPLAVQFEYNPGPGNWACQIAGDPINLVDCLGDLNPNQSVTIKVSVFMTAESGKPLDNQACVDPDHLIEQYNPPGRTDDCSTHTTIVGGTKRSPNLFVTKNGDPTQVTSGETLTYVIGVQNNGDADAFSPVTITDPLPSSVTFVDANATNGWNCSGTTTVTCHDNGSGLAIGASSTITIHTTVNDGVTTPIVNTATAAPATHNPAETDAEDETFAHQGDNTATSKSSTGGSAFDLVLSSITDNPDPVIPGQGLKYTIVAVNGGTGDANGVHVSVALPSVTSATFLSADGSNGFNCSGPVANVLDCVGDLPSGGDTTITVSLIVLVQPIPAPDLVLTATIDPSNAFAESNEGNNSQTETTTISGLTCTNCIDLVAAQLVPSADPLLSGGSETFTFQVVNVGDTSTALDPTKDTLIQFNYAAATSLTPGMPVSSNPAVVCTSTSSGSPVNAASVSCTGNLGPGEGVTITIPITNVIGNLFAVGMADPVSVANPNGKVAESNETNNVLSESVVVF
jgi:uncharacterized repeat protein (TIGR01451 family)